MLSAIDIDRRIIPNNIVPPGFSDRAGRELHRAPVFESMAAGFGAALFLLLAALAYPRGMGWATSSFALLLRVAVGRYVPIPRSSPGRSGPWSRPQCLAGTGMAAGKMTIPFGRSWPSAGLLALLLRQAPARRLSDFL